MPQWAEDLRKRAGRIVEKWVRTFSSFVVREVGQECVVEGSETQSMQERTEIATVQARARAGAPPGCVIKSDGGVGHCHCHCWERLLTF